MQLQETSLGAAARSPDERALAAIPLPHLAPDVRRYLARDRAGASRRARMFCRRKLPPFEIVDEQFECALYHASDVAVRDAVPQQVLRAPEVSVAFARQGELDLVGLR